MLSVITSLGAKGFLVKTRLGLEYLFYRHCALPAENTRLFFFFFKPGTLQSGNQKKSAAEFGCLALFAWSGNASQRLLHRIEDASPPLNVQSHATGTSRNQQKVAKNRQSSPKPFPLSYKLHSLIFRGRFYFNQSGRKQTAQSLHSRRSAE